MKLFRLVKNENGRKLYFCWTPDQDFFWSESAEFAVPHAYNRHLLRVAKNKGATVERYIESRKLCYDIRFNNYVLARFVDHFCINKEHIKDFMRLY